uniref:E3 ubiquitin-protein ligase TRIM21-like n=1 Tax=Haplochromis burtoni TaxID=8153 RepID=A0A3Q2W0M4_HAPBU
MAKEPEELLNILEDLTDDEFEGFKWRLQQGEVLASRPTIKKSRLQTAKRRDTVDLMVHTYTLPGAVEVTRKVLERVCRNDLLQSLSASSEQQAAVPGEVPCDVCTGSKLKALKSCMVCLTSYCETHLEPHLTASRLRRHHLVEPLENLEGRMCMKHDKPLELFCKTDQTCVCTLCSVFKHKTHEFLKDSADREKAEGFQVFTALQESAERGMKKLMKEIEGKQKTTEKQAEGFIKDLEQEISELKKTSSQMEQLSHSEDHLHVLQSFSSLKTVLPTKDWTEIRVHPPSYEGTVVRAVAQLEEKLRKCMKKKLLESELERVQQYAVDVTLDPDTANSRLILSDDGKQVHCGDVRKNLPDIPQRFSPCPNVLGKQSLSSGRFYFEVQVKGKTAWDLGVASELVNRKGKITLTPQDGFWSLGLRNRNEYRAFASPSVRLCYQSGPEKVWVFVDYEEGLVSFYDVDTAALIYSFTSCSFIQKLHPYFSPCLNDGGENSAPLINCPVNQIESINRFYLMN